MGKQQARAPAKPNPGFSSPGPCFCFEPEAECRAQEEMRAACSHGTGPGRWARPHPCTMPRHPEGPSFPVKAEGALPCPDERPENSGLEVEEAPFGVTLPLLLSSKCSRGAVLMSPLPASSAFLAPAHSLLRQGCVLFVRCVPPLQPSVEAVIRTSRQTSSTRSPCFPVGWMSPASCSSYKLPNLGSMGPALW